MAVPEHHSQPDGDEGAAQGEDDGPERHEVDHGRVDPSPAVDPQTQRHEHERQQGGGDGHDDAGEQKERKKERRGR